MGGFNVYYSNQSALKLTNESVKPLIINGKGIWNGVTQNEASMKVEH